MAKHHPDLIFCRKQAGVGKLICNNNNYNNNNKSNVDL